MWIFVKKLLQNESLFDIIAKIINDRGAVFKSTIGQLVKTSGTG